MKRTVLLAVLLLLTACGSHGATYMPSLLGFLPGQIVRNYSVADLPSGWSFDPSQIEGVLLPAVFDPNLAPNDPNLWLVPCGLLERQGVTNDWVKEIRPVRVVGTIPAGVAVFISHDPQSKKSLTWRVDVWSIPGPWYIVLDAVSQPGKNGQSKVQRYTVVGAGYVPDDYVPLLQ
jgi:hypothetical protein